MKNIQITHLKDANFTPARILEKSIFINKKDCESTYKEILELKNDIIGLKEALFFKHEKLKLQLLETKKKIDGKVIENLNNKLLELNIKSLGKSKEVLQQNKEIFELKLINKIVRYNIEVKNKNLNILYSLLKSEEKDDWKFLCLFLRTTLETYDNDIKNEIIEISKKIQEKMINVFDDGKKFNNKTMMKSAYMALSELDDNNTLLQTYIYDMEIFKKVYEMSHPKIENIDIDLYEEEKNTFLNFLNKIKSSYQENLVDLSEIFYNYEKAYKIINEKIFYDLIIPTLERFLKNTIPFTFLYSLENAFKNIEFLGVYIESVTTSFNLEEIFIELKDRFSALSIDKERSFFSEIFEKLVYNTDTKVDYFFNGKKIVLTKNYTDIINIIIKLINLFYNRCDLLYENEDIKDMNMFFFGKLNTLIDVIYEKTTDKIETISEIQKIYYIINSNLKPLEIFNDHVKYVIKESLKWQIDQSKSRIKQIINRISFFNNDLDLYILEYLKEQVVESKRINGNLKNLYIENIFVYCSNKIKNRIFDFRMCESQKRNLKLFIKKVLDYVCLLGQNIIIKPFKEIENIIILITVDKNNLNDMCNILKFKLKESDLKKALKCRKDKK